jgi:hypothetical protein
MRQLDVARIVRATPTKRHNMVQRPTERVRPLQIRVNSDITKTTNPTITIRDSREHNDLASRCRFLQCTPPLVAFASCITPRLTRFLTRSPALTHAMQRAMLLAAAVLPLRLRCERHATLSQEADTIR